MTLPWSLGSVLILVLSLCLPMAAKAEDVSYSPPYPDIWGRKLPVDGSQRSDVRVRIYKNEAGDVQAYESYWGEAKSEIKPIEVRRLSFFSGEDKIVPAEELYEKNRKYVRPKYGLFGDMTFPDDKEVGLSKFHYKLQGDWQYCIKMEPLWSIDRKIKTEDFVIVRKVFVRLFPHEVAREVIGNLFCGDNKRPTTYRSRVFISTVYGIQNSVLADNTFVAVWDDTFLVRFDLNLNSPYVDASPDLFALPFQQLEPILIETNRREEEDPTFNSLQFLHDRLTEIILAIPKPAVQ